MFDFNSVETPKRLNRDFILSKVTDAQIFFYYFGRFDLKNVYPSKFHKDRNPSTGFYISKSGKIIYNHLNGREPKLDCFAFVQRLYGLDFRDTIKRIAFDFGLISGNPNPMADKVLKDLAKFDRTYKKETRIHFTVQPWGVENLPFWKTFHITKDELKRDGYYCIDKLYINDQLIPNYNNCLRYALTVPYKDELLTKVYSPGGDDKLKWVSNIPLDLPFGVDKLNKNSPFCFTAKALKDYTVIRKFLPSVIASQNESRAAMSDKTIKKLQFYFPTNYLGWDNDEPGLEAMEEMRPLGFEPMPVEEDDIKDYSDLGKEKGLKAVEQFFKRKGLI